MRWEILISGKESKHSTSHLAYKASRLRMNPSLTLPALASSAVPFQSCLKIYQFPFPMPRNPTGFTQFSYFFFFFIASLFLATVRTTQNATYARISNFAELPVLNPKGHFIILSHKKSKNKKTTVLYANGINLNKCMLRFLLCLQSGTTRCCRGRTALG